MKKHIALALLILTIGCTTNQKSRLDLSGEWNIKLDPEDIGLNEKWFDTAFDDRILLPGSLQEQGFGNDVDINTPWTGQVVDSS